MLSSIQSDHTASIKQWYDCPPTVTHSVTICTRELNTYHN